MSNIAEGFGRGTQAELVTFLGYAIGSLDETRSHLCAAHDRGYLPRNEYAELFGQGTEIRKMTVGFIQSMAMARSGVKHLCKIPDWSEQVWEIYERLTGKPRPELFQKAAEEKRRGRSEANEVRGDQGADGTKSLSQNLARRRGTGTFCSEDSAK